ncbi:MAG: hypothetical protein QOF58_8275, partial [Pseudonocardiales bacterium]|nr:hypothetical protein [Pseudonocardiales bacterium]
MSEPACRTGVQSLDLAYIKRLNVDATRFFIPEQEAAGGIPKSVIELAGTALTFYVNEKGQFVVALEFEETPDELMVDTGDGGPEAQVLVKFNGIRQNVTSE